MTHATDLYEPGDDREPEPCEWYPAPEPVDLDEVEAAREQALIEIDENGAVGEENTELVLRQMLPRLLGELREARQRTAEWEALETREEWATTPHREIPPNKNVPFRVTPHHALKEAQKGQRQVWRRMLSVHPWEPIDDAAPF
ncbi:pseudouridine-5'-phosphate glycosidase [Nonomuraea turkmeniaca]|uniref:Pseudouridine-5'-phosphate glycosidase n=1 Tax=Nonomuraea turkmeniaca TaxID=103838 RepID=A0A5S4F592_9ACTN|nr:pseudouridine-5'-phosphate glycosidase [Nonomuraea turkmeniaca]TMR11062.1 pseudouridine-5'-phosphate glycosidase [Nonomuraea turkmeniaca]